MARQGRVGWQAHVAGPCTKLASSGCDPTCVIAWSLVRSFSLAARPIAWSPSRPTSRSSKRPEDAEAIDVRNDQVSAEPCEHADTVISLTKLSGCGVEQGADVASETLRRAVVKVIGYVGDGKARVLEEPRGTNQTRHGQISLGRGNTGPEESAHQRARSHVEVAGKQSHIPEAWGAREDGLEKVPTVIWYTRQVDSQLAQYAALTGISGIGHQRATKLPPASGLPNIDETFDATLPECQHGMRRPDLELAEKCDGWDAWKFANE